MILIIEWIAARYNYLNRMINIGYVLFILAPMVLGVAALMGLHLARRLFYARPRPLALAMIHLSTALAGSGLLAAAVIMSPKQELSVLALIFIGAALAGGAAMLLMRIKKSTPPRLLVVLHASTAITGIAVTIAIVVGLGD